MYYIKTTTFIPFEFETATDCAQYIENLVFGEKHSIFLIKKDTEHLELRCPVSGEYIEVISDEHNISLVDDKLKQRNLYRL